MGLMPRVHRRSELPRKDQFLSLFFLGAAITGAAVGEMTVASIGFNVMALLILWKTFIFTLLALPGALLAELRRPTR